MLDTSKIKDSLFASDVLSGLSEPQKVIPCQWLYDERGSVLFEDITQLPEYYPTRTETSILKACAHEIADFAGPNINLVEYGSGASVKTRLLLDALKDVHAYVPIDVSAEFLSDSADGLKADYPKLTVASVVGDFLSPISLPEQSKGAGRSVGFFPGSTIGNLSDEEIKSFFARARHDLGSDAAFVLGADLKKNVDRLIPAYDDAAGVTADFNLNLLVRVNRELAGDFVLEQFAHEARWNEARNRIEMHLVSLVDQNTRVCGQQFAFCEGETIHTENSRKFDQAELARLVETQGWQTTSVWTDDEDLFSVMMLEAA
jgi:L-histidine Nalpha-methyltransferase